jgi:hypothetical protein
VINHSTGCTTRRQFAPAPLPHQTWRTPNPIRIRGSGGALPMSIVSAVRTGPPVRPDDVPVVLAHRQLMLGTAPPSDVTSIRQASSTNPLPRPPTANGGRTCAEIGAGEPPEPQPTPRDVRASAGSRSPSSARSVPATGTPTPR